MVEPPGYEEPPGILEWLLWIGFWALPLLVLVALGVLLVFVVIRSRRRRPPYQNQPPSQPPYQS
ncbi:hypothetical protein GCM10029976_087710 [Kribbella albertanoniae]|uniref:Uncharacterized protein n=1 Tax=Kribbella albertanoniae TaxID=1266829 RepID=A0A4R4QI23_9ACTN|nr:hypothetical protein [Kribbella albertanoniae]TDC35308.1 hypothetical protein E1261_01915 [Kribbella albertanoniae]